MPSLNFERTAIDTEVHKVFGDFTNQGFEIQPAALKSTSAIGDYIEIVLLNQLVKRSLIITYAPATKIRPESISIFLENQNGETFSVSEFLSYKGINVEVSDSIKIIRHSGSLTDKLEGVLVALKDVINKYLKEYLFENNWISVPIQWNDVK